jgi:hypothetical protein
MKKTLIAVLTAVAIAAGPALVAGPAIADPYTPVTPTKHHTKMIDNHITAKQHPKVYFRVTAPGNAKPHGWVYFTIRHNGKVVKTVQRRYHRYHPNEAYVLPKFSGSKHGKTYRIVMRFVQKGFETAVGHAHFTVKSK